MNESQNTKKAIFLDRDGVLNDAIVLDKKPFPPMSIDQVTIRRSTIEACDILKRNGFLLICITNQPDISRGKTSTQTVAEINEFVRATLKLDALYTCPHSDEDHCFCRKPRPGMIIQGLREFDLLPGECFMIGDRWRDIECGHLAGCKTIFIDQQYNEPRPTTMNYTCHSLLSALPYILNLDLPN